MDAIAGRRGTGTRAGSFMGSPGGMATASTAIPSP
jgi:hypothetical protein